MSLGQRVIRAMGWSAAAKVGFQVITWVMTLAVIRVLSPDDYGLMALSVCPRSP
jgi:teichuronic acid exporter